MAATAYHKNIVESMLPLLNSAALHALNDEDLKSDVGFPLVLQRIGTVLIGCYHQEGLRAAKSCVSLSSSRNAVSFSSACTT